VVFVTQLQPGKPPVGIVFDTDMEDRIMSLAGHEGPRMKTAKFTYWQDGDYYLGFLNDYPEYQTQGMSKEELVTNLRDLLADLESGEIPYIRKVEELVLTE
jgi:predicted RNase H-like HicB family nuclease